MDDPSQEMSMLLQLENALLRKGRLTELTELIPQKVAAMKNLEDAPEVDLSALRQKAIQNEKLLKAAISGVGSARERLKGLGTTQSLLQTYTAAGRRENIHVSSPSVQRRK